MNSEQTDTTATVAAQGAQVAPERPSAKKKATRKKGPPQGQKGAKAGRKAAPRKAKASKKSAHAKEATTLRPETKGAKILALIGRPEGASLAEVMKATGWLPHSVRGFLSTAAKKHGLKIESLKNAAGERCYSIRK